MRTPYGGDGTAWQERALEAEAALIEESRRADALNHELRLACERLHELQQRSARRGQLLRQAARAAELGEHLGEDILRLVLDEI